MTTAVPLQLSLDAPHGSIQAIDTTNDTDGSTRYQLSGPRLAGSITITGQRWPDTDFPTLATLALGHHPNPDGPVHDRPTVNGIEASGSATINLNTIDQLTPNFLNPYRVRYRHGDSHLPSTSSRYLGAAALAVTRHWSRRPDRDTLTLSTARYYAPRRLEHLQNNTIGPLREKINQATRELDDARRLAAFLQALTEGTDPRAATAPQQEQHQREHSVLALLRDEGYKISDALRAYAEQQDEAAAEARQRYQSGQANPAGAVKQGTTLITNQGYRESADRLAANAADAVRLANEVDDFADGGRR
jgi:hypothetical protein